jgi:hypothetical protein
MKKQLATLAESINSLLKEKGCRSNYQEKHIAGMEFPRFTGKNPSTWIFRANQFFEHHKIPIWDRIPIAVFHMKGEALSWFHEVEGLGLYNTWEKIVEALQFRFQEDEARTQEANQRAFDNLNEILSEEVGQDLLQEDANDMQFQKISDLVQEDEDDMQIQKIPTPLEGVDNQKVESYDDISPNMANNDEDLDWFFGCESMDCKKLQLIPEKVEIKQEIKNKDLGEQHLVKKNSNFERLSCSEVQSFDNTPQRKLDDGVFFLWCVRWCFDPGKKHFILRRLRKMEEEVTGSCSIKWA